MAVVITEVRGHISNVMAIGVTGADTMRDIDWSWLASLRSASELKGCVKQLANVSLDSIDSTLFISTLDELRHEWSFRMAPNLGFALATWFAIEGD